MVACNWLSQENGLSTPHVIMTAAPSVLSLDEAEDPDRAHRVAARGGAAQRADAVCTERRHVPASGRCCKIIMSIDVVYTV